MNSRALFCNFVHFHLPSPVHGASGSRAPAQEVVKDPPPQIPSYLVYDKIARVLRASPEASLFLRACARSFWVGSAGHSSLAYRRLLGLKQIELAKEANVGRPRPARPRHVDEE